MTERPIRKSSPWMRLLPLIVLLLVFVAVGIWKWDALFPGSGPQAPSVPAAGPAEPSPERAGGGTGALPGGEELTAAERHWLETTGTMPSWPGDFDNPADCAGAVEFLRQLCRRLDSRPYVQDWDLEEGTFGLLLKVSEDLEARPPVIEGELKRHGSMLQNVSHLFRVLGEKRVRRLVEMTMLEPEMREPMALALYRWGRVRQRCEGDQPRPMNLNAQYDYAAWLTTTIGGQAYLRRRAPELEALASFYSLLILDRAEEKGYNPYGVDPRPEIQRCRDLMRSGDLVFRDRYLEILDGIDRRWKAR